jgi:putative lipase involved disintegration of autophagic bodies
LSGAQNVLLPLLLSRFLLYPRKRARDAAAMRAHIFDVDKNMQCIFEITTINKQKRTGQILSGRDTLFDDIVHIG